MATPCSARTPRCSRPVAPLDHRQPCRARSLAGVVEKLEDLAECATRRFCIEGFAYALRSGARRPPGDTPHADGMTSPRELLTVPLDDLMAEARRLRRLGTGTLVTYSPKVFVPLTTLCRDVCGYCTFARPPRRGERAYLSEEEVLAIARAGAEAGCTGGALHARRPPEARYRVAREELAALGCATTLEYLARLRAARARGDGAAAAPEPRA